MASAEHRIFRITEMVEAILSELPQQDLLLSKAVCRTWSEIIDSSEKLQKTLFFMPESDVRFIINKAGDIYPDSRSVDSATFGPTPNPLLTELTDAMYWGGCSFSKNGKFILPGTYAAREGNWKGMLLTQPALSSVYIDIMWTGKGGTLNQAHLTQSKIVNTHGVTMGDWIQALEDARRKVPRIYTFVKSLIDSDDLWVP